MLIISEYFMFLSIWIQYMKFWWILYIYNYTNLKEDFLQAVVLSLCLNSQYCNKNKCERIILGQQSFSVKGQVVTILGFMGHMVSVSTTQLQCCSRNAIIYINEKGMALFQPEHIDKSRWRARFGLWAVICGPIF